MKTNLLKLSALIMALFAFSGCSNMNQQQKNTAIGATIGGVAGNVIGNSTGATLGGAALGGVIGSQIK
ncbi:glycine zipper 2TM domain-containing protein [Testudinibacter sp. TR-2022]|nr:glycine zipper 2TM domain-containing protein [Testudinibacter sp. TR-2022]TNH05974.1 glycine zipper 2TM domain-containing protein [Pasteurellaceae bacterium Phil11]TNH19087.1 glycine zipper 2TM domain-containing protein [Testudinibacter sp. TR-2022]TNH29206.1 glycine zipper 2TM domain-containing protein [Testudinibacter sp. TR-2022]